MVPCCGSQSHPGAAWSHPGAVWSPPMGQRMLSRLLWLWLTGWQLSEPAAPRPTTLLQSSLRPPSCRSPENDGTALGHPAKALHPCFVSQGDVPVDQTWTAGRSSRVLSRPRRPLPPAAKKKSALVLESHRQQPAGTADYRAFLRAIRKDSATLCTAQSTDPAHGCAQTGLRGTPKLHRNMARRRVGRPAASNTGVTSGKETACGQHPAGRRLFAIQNPDRRQHKQSWHWPVTAEDKRPVDKDS